MVFITRASDDRYLKFLEDDFFTKERALEVFLSYYGFKFMVKKNLYFEKSIERIIKVFDCSEEVAEKIAGCHLNFYIYDYPIQ